MADEIKLAHEENEESLYTPDPLEVSSQPIIAQPIQSEMPAGQAAGLDPAVADKPFYPADTSKTSFWGGTPLDVDLPEGMPGPNWQEGGPTVGPFHVAQPGEGTPQQGPPPELGTPVFGEQPVQSWGQQPQGGDRLQMLHDMLMSGPGGSSVGPQRAATDAYYTKMEGFAKQLGLSEDQKTEFNFMLADVAKDRARATTAMKLADTAADEEKKALKDYRARQVEAEKQNKAHMDDAITLSEHAYGDDSEVLAAAETLRREDATESEKADAQEVLEKAKEISTDPFEGSGWKRVVAALVAGLGAFGSSLTKSPNYALKILDDQVKRHIMKQKDQAALKKSAVDRAYKKEYLRMNQAAAEKANIHAEAAAVYNRANRSLQKLSSGIKDAGFQAQIQQFITSVEDRATQSRAAAYTTGHQGLMGSLDRKMQLDASERQMRNRAAFEAFKEEGEGTFIPQAHLKPGIKPIEETKKELTTEYNKYTAVKSTVQHVSQGLRELASGSITAKAFSRSSAGQSLAQIIAIAENMSKDKLVKAGAALSERELKMLQDLIAGGDITRWGVDLEGVADRMQNLITYQAKLTHDMVSPYMSWDQNAPILTDMKTPIWNLEVE